MDQLKDRHAHFMVQTPPVRTNNEPLTGKYSSPRAPVPDAVALAQRTYTVALLQKLIEAFTEKFIRQMQRGTNTELAGLAAFSPEIKSATMPVGMMLPSFTKFTGKTGPKEQIAEFQSQMSFQYPCSKVYYRAFLSSLARHSPEPKRRSALDRIQVYTSGDVPRRSAFSRTQGDPRKKKEVKEGKIEYLTPLNASAGNVFMEIEDKRILSQPPRQKTPPPQNKRDISKFWRVKVISRARSGGGDSRSARRAYAKRYIYAVTAGACPKFLDLSFSRKYFEGDKVPNEDPPVITLVITNFEVRHMLVDIVSSADILFLDAYLKLGISRVQIRPEAMPLVGFTGDKVSPLGVSNLMVTMGKHPQGDSGQSKEGLGMLPSLQGVHEGPDRKRGLVEDARGAPGPERIQYWNNAGGGARGDARMSHQYRDVFVWEPKDMPGVDPEVAVHWLYVDPHYKPVKEKKKRTFSVEKGEEIREEVDKLLWAGAIRVLLFPTWLT
ncbi:hypothetical protein LIER_15455 [Lithospermum erythrorhizon]|uniref:Uncharacterized protein n=1 Tax=Lithospermum erythrorhizon TaxID=34254 RepID=A0AAV3Q3Z6_LITER